MIIEIGNYHAIIVVIREIYVNFQCNLTIYLIIHVVFSVFHHTRIELTIIVIIVIFVHDNNRIAKYQYQYLYQYRPSLLLFIMASLFSVTK